MSNKIERLQKIADDLNRRANKGKDAAPVVFFANTHPELLDYGLIETGNLTLDEALGGGFRRGIFAMIWGREGSGKSRLCLDIIAHNQNQDPNFVALFLHLEDRAFPYQAAQAAGVDLSRLIVITIQEHGEATFDLVMRYLCDGENKPLNLVDLVVVDSVAAMLPAAESESINEKGLEATTVGRQAAMLSKMLRILAGALGKTLMIFISQVRKNIDGRGNPDIASGGKAVQFYSKVIIRLDNAGLVKSGEEVVGHTIAGRIGKNNTGIGKPQAQFHYNVIYGKGVDRIGPIIDAGLASGVLTQSGSWLMLPNGDKIQGRQNLITLLENDTYLCSALQEAIRNV